ncbi:hypothetical protein H4S01_005658 [Coemansia sp. RSA 2610]|nr:hypothetical protein H4S01_005658 [Coemansia sp. RSA 2610]
MDTSAPPDHNQNHPGDTNIEQLLQTIKDAQAFVSNEQDAGTAAAPAAVDAGPAAIDADTESSETDSSSDSDLDVDSDDETDGKQRNLLQLMEDDEDEDGPSTSTTMKTRNEVLDPEIPALTVTSVPDSAQLCPLGAIHSVVDGSVIIQANISGETHVLDSESMVVFADRTALGMIFDVFGPVARPMYTVRFRKPEDIDRSVCAVGRPVFYALGWARMLSTDRLRVKGTDASNEFDEEVADDAMEFSDDEAEASFKREKKRREQELKGRFREPRVPPARQPQQQRPAVPAQSDQTAGATAPSVAGRKLQSYEDICDPDYGF